MIAAKNRRPALLRALLMLAPLAAGTAAPADPLAGTAPLTAEGDLATQMVEGIHRFLDAETAASIDRRARHWQRDDSSREAYERSLAPHRARLLQIVGAVDPRVSFNSWTIESAATMAGDWEISQVRWPALRSPGGVVVEGEGLLWAPGTASGEPAAKPRLNLILIPDADITPEDFAGLSSPDVPGSDFGWRLVQCGCRLLIPTLVDRTDEHSVVGGVRKTNQPHREFVYRQAYELGRHVIGYELQKVLAAVDWFKTHEPETTVAVYGYGEGGLLALYAGAADSRIDGVCVSGYFDSRQDLWQEPIYRNVWSLLDQFGDAELAAMIAPRPLVIETQVFPTVVGPPAPRDGRSGAAPGRLVTPDAQRVQAELSRAEALLAGAKIRPRFEIVSSGGELALLSRLGIDFPVGIAGLGSGLRAPISEPDRAGRFRRQFDQLMAYTQDLLREAEYTRRDFGAAADRASVDTWKATTPDYRARFYNDVIGRFDRELLPPAPRSRQVYDEPKFTGYEVMLDVFSDVFAYGILLVPKDLKPGERRPVVVCQHGLEGRPQDVADPQVDSPYYHRFACQLAERGFITYAPQNPYIGQDHFRSLQRKANPLGKSLFSIIIPQHQQAVRWLATQPFVDPARIGFYGLSYGGKTAMRVPAVVEEYCLSICSADFNEWIWKNASSRSPYSYLGTGEYEMFEFDLGNTFNYAEMAGLIAPRPFMVERGHHDGVAPDEWVAYEYAKVRKLYADLKIPDRTEIEFFDGPHTIHGVGTFAFLHEHLGWPAPEAASGN